MRSAVTLLASIPSPSSGVLELGPITIHMYGLMLLAGIAACIFITGKRWVARGGDWDLIFRVAVWGVGAGIVGARLYHLATSWSEVPDEWWGPFAVWEGGLGIWGGIAGGVLVGGIVAKRAGASVTELLDAAAPGLLVAQAIGRVGNWWNQELFGEPTDRAWGLEIDLEHRPPEFADSATFTRLSCTRACGTCSPRACSCSSTASSGSGRPRSSRSTWRSTARSACTRRRCGSTAPTTSGANA